MVILLTLFFNKTRAGRALRACSQNREAAALLGIPVGAMLMLSFALSALSGTESSTIARAAAAPRRTPLWPWLAAALALVAVSAATWFVARRPQPTTRMQFALAVPDEISVSHMALSRDGKLLVFVSPEESSALPMLFVQRVGSSSVTPLVGATA